MGSIFGAIYTATSSMTAFQRGLDVAQADVVNASTPGYVKQTQTFVPTSLDIDRGLPGGVLPGHIQSSRDEFAEQAVRTQQQNSSAADQRTSDLASVEPFFTISAQSGIAAAFNGFFKAAADLAVSPNSTVSRQGLLTQAATVANGFNQTASALSNAGINTDRHISSATDQVNQLLDQVKGLNSSLRHNQGLSTDPAFDANVHNTLDSLSKLVNFDAVKASDGTTTILLGAGQIPAVIGEHEYKIQTSLNGLSSSILDSQGNNITAQISSGQLGALLTSRNTTLPSYQTDLNQLASAFANQVNTTLANGLDQNGNPPVGPLFTVSATPGEAATIAVNPTIQTTDLGVASASAPGGNGNALALSSLAGAKTLNGLTFTASYGNLAARAGTDIAQAKQDSSVASDLLRQAQSFRQDTSGISLDEEAARVLQFQKSFTAAAKLVTVLSQMSDSILALVT